MGAAIVWNPGAGGAADLIVDDIAARVGGDGAPAAVYAITADRDPAACARAALADGADPIIAAGGDGTVSAVAGVLAGGPARLGVLPVGTSNSFAAALDLPAALEPAIATVRAGQERVVDVARVRCGDARRIMILHTVIGLHAAAVVGASREAKQRWGLLAYAASTARELGDLASFEVALEVNQREIRCRAIDVAVANLAPPRTVYAHGPARLAPDDGLIDVTIVAAETLTGAIAAGLHLYRSARQGTPATRDDIGFLSCARVRIATTPVREVLVDGERLGDTPVELDVWPGALRVLAPPPPPDDRDAARGVKLAGLPDLEIGPS
ncbi:MAG TPA: diacylglycerol kinase family protein [Kofleriaceae bacterium]|nr:diacylglycerol kinase family protein [Kofleriaceae bacterium]